MKLAAGDATVSTQMFRPILFALEAAGIDVEKFAAEVDLPLDALKDPDRRLPRELAVRTWLAASTVTGDDLFGLHVAESAPIGMYGALEYAIRVSPTAGQALVQLARYYKIVSNLSSVAMEKTDDVVRITHNATTASAVVDNLFVTIVRVGRELTRTPFLPRMVHLLRPPPRQTDQHQKFFRAPVIFSAEENALVFDASTLDLPLVTADAALHAALLQRSEAILNALPSSDRFVRTVRVTVIKSLQSGKGTSLEHLAATLEMSARTLQRRLAENTTTLSELVDSVRHELALSYLADDISALEVAYLLGFSEAAAFQRAFKRWTGASLKELRARRRAERSSQSFFRVKSPMVLMKSIGTLSSKASRSIGPSMGATSASNTSPNRPYLRARSWSLPRKKSASSPFVSPSISRPRRERSFLSTITRRRRARYAPMITSGYLPRSAKTS